MDELDEIIAWIRARGPQPLPLDGWDHASIWGWNETAGSLYAHLWRNTDDPAGPPAIKIEADHFTPAITLPETLSQYIGMALDCSPWSVTRPWTRSLIRTKTGTAGPTTLGAAKLAP